VLAGASHHSGRLEIETWAANALLVVMHYWSSTMEAEMRCFWEQTGVLGPIYRLLGQGLDDSDIAGKLNLTESKVQDCVAWIVHFLHLKTRQELVLYTSCGT
jgi:hypothetical protein